MKRINREILSLAVPSIVTNITTPLLALMDVVIVGHMGSADYIAAIAVGGTIFNMMYWLFALPANGIERNDSSGKRRRRCFRCIAHIISRAVCSRYCIFADYPAPQTDFPCGNGFA